MSKEVSVRLPERVWREMIDYEPVSARVPLPPEIRTQLRAGVAHTEEKPARLDYRIATFSADEARRLETWVTAASIRRDAPTGVGVALAAVIDAIRLAQ
jgi:hypothetical protein